MQILAAVDYNCRGELNEQSINFHQEILCSLRFRRSGMLTITPGFDFRDSRLPHQSAYTAQFTTPRGIIYEYSLERVNAPLSQVSLKERAMIGAHLFNETRALQLRQRRLYMLRSTLRRRLETKEENPVQYRAIIQIISVQYEMIAPLLSVEYDLLLPDGINQCDSSVSLQGSSTFTSSSNYHGRESTSYGIEINAKLIFVLLAAFTLCSIEPNLCSYLIFFYAFPCGAVVFYLFTGNSTLKRSHHRLSEFHFNIFIDFLYGLAKSDSSHKEFEGVLSSKLLQQQQQHPKLVLKLLSKSGLRTDVVGYGSITVPINHPGSFKITTHLWRPIGGIVVEQQSELRRRLENYYIGGTYHISKEDIDPRRKACTINPDSSNNIHNFESRYGLLTESAGACIHIKVTNYTPSNCDVKNTRMQRISPNPQQGSTLNHQSEMKYDHSNIDKLLSRLSKKSFRKKNSKIFDFSKPKKQITPR